MHTLENDRVAEPLEYYPCLLEGVLARPREWRPAAAGSICIHSVVLLILLAIPRELPEATENSHVRRVTPLVDPPTRLTQIAPNKNPLSDEITVGSSSRATRSIKAPPSPVKRFSPPPAQAVRHSAPASVPQEPPKVPGLMQSVQILPPSALSETL